MKFLSQPKTNSSLTSKIAFFSSDHLHLSVETQYKILVALVTYVFKQTFIGMFSSIICATIVFIGLFFEEKLRAPLYIWASFYFLVTFSRIVLAHFFKRDKYPQKRINLWARLYTVGATLGGISWGFLGIFLFPYAAAPEQTLLILMLAGVTAGATSLSASIPIAAVSFLIFSLTPFIVSLLFANSYLYLLFDAALFLYTIYSITLVYKGFQLIKNAMVLQFQNEELLQDLSAAKEQLEETNKMLEHAATHDPLTDVANRNLFYTRLETAIKNAKLNNAQFALLYIDFDRFKLVNDIYGHHIGDQLLVSIIDRLKNIFKPDTTVARLGGDELAIILENVTTREEIAYTAQEICHIIAEPFRINNIGLKIGASIGISLYPQDGKNSATLLWQADRAMYQVKNAGGNYYEFSANLTEMI